MKDQERIVALIDMDCFYVQVEERECPSIKGTPAAVVQYNSWKGGGIIAVNYEAREYGVKRGMRGDDAKEKCPTIKLLQVPVLRGKADLAKYRNAGREVINVLSEFSQCVERASVDEAYIDLTEIVHQRVQSQDYHVSVSDLPHTWVVPVDKNPNSQHDRVTDLSQWMSTILTQNDTEDMFASTPEHTDQWRHNVQLLIAAKIIEDIRRAVLQKTSFKCSAGISFNKMLSKLACGLHKPNQQTVLSRSAVPNLWTETPVGKVRLLGGKLGYCLSEDLGCKTMSQLSSLSLRVLRAKFDEKTAHWLEGLGRGEDPEPVRPRQLPKSVGCSKSFSGNDVLTTLEKMIKWIQDLTEELAERLEEDSQSNCRRPRTLTISVHMDSECEVSSFSKSVSLMNTKAERLSDLVQTVLNSTEAAKKPKWFQSIRVLGLSAGKFEDSIGTKSIQDIFKKTEKLPRMKAPIKTSPNDESSMDSPCTSKQEPPPKKSGKGSFFQHYRQKLENEKKVERTIEKECEPPEVCEETRIPPEVCEEERIPPEVCEEEWIPPNVQTLQKAPNLEVEEPTNLELLVHQLDKEHDDPDIVGELFPDLDSVDESVLELLPQNIQDRVREAVAHHHKNRGTSVSLYTQCSQCKKGIETFKLPEHMDYHMAVSLRQEQIKESRKPLSGRSPQKTAKRGRKRKQEESSIKMQKINNYFKK